MSACSPMFKFLSQPTFYLHVQFPLLSCHPVLLSVDPWHNVVGEEPASFVLLLLSLSLLLLNQSKGLSVNAQHRSGLLTRLGAGRCSRGSLAQYLHDIHSMQFVQDHCMVNKANANFCEIIWGRNSSAPVDQVIIHKRVHHP